MTKTNFYITEICSRNKNNSLTTEKNLRKLNASDCKTKQKDRFSYFNQYEKRVIKYPDEKRTW